MRFCQNLIYLLILYKEKHYILEWRGFVLEGHCAVEKSANSAIKSADSAIKGHPSSYRMKDKKQENRGADH
jgi:hypothetical protein